MLTALGQDLSFISIKPFIFRCFVVDISGNVVSLQAETNTSLHYDSFSTENQGDPDGSVHGADKRDDR